MTFGTTNTWNGYINNPASNTTINVSGNLYIKGTAGIGGTNLTIDMVGNNKTLDGTGINNGSFKSNLILSGLSTSILNAYYIGDSSAYFTVSGTATAISNMYLYFGTVTIDSNCALDTSTYSFSASYNVVNNGSFIGSGAWTIIRNFTNGATGTVSAPATWEVGTNFANSGTIIHNNGTLTIGTGSYSGSPVYTFDPGNSDYYNFVFKPNGYSGSYVHIAIARSFNVLGNLTFGTTNTWNGYVDNPASNTTINVSGNLYIKNGSFSCSNLTVDMNGVSANLSATNTIALNLRISGDVSAISNISLSSNILIDNGGIFDIAGYNFTAYTNSTVENNGNLVGTGTWDVQKDFTNGSAGVVSAPATWKVKRNFINSGSVSHNNGTLIIGENAPSSTTTVIFDPGSSNLYNLQMVPSYSTYALHINFARSFDVLGNFSFGGSSSSYNGYVDNPASFATINVSGNVNIGTYGVFSADPILLST